MQIIVRLMSNKSTQSLRSSLMRRLILPYLDESRQLHAVRRAREGGQFKRKSENQQQEYESGEESQANLNLNSDKKDPTSSENGS
ncbi:nuclear transcription factor Y subunit A-7 [Olea europaea subsp. europaea]|uniref:Nuclear transcription factor Y subunit A-7 n=1 Tax=Olea europaea subsp. europaea TaxID=158383 RepID=A0A8S0P909_OLEEU|nr:nuclear transcription factor Y subunit A-7 [Olea europaea subsp. europaea]